MKKPFRLKVHSMGIPMISLEDKEAIQMAVEKSVNLKGHGVRNEQIAFGRVARNSFRAHSNKRNKE